MNKQITLTAEVEGTPKNNAYKWDVTGDTTAVSYDKSITGNTLNITGVKKGTITVTVTVDGVKSKAHTVTVQDKITLDRTTATVKVGESTTLQAKINGVNSTEVTWESSDTTIATVDDNGNVTAKKEGTATITATAKADTTKTATCTITVTEKNNTNEIKIELDKTVLSLGEGDSATLRAKINGVVSAEVTWSSDNSDIASVDNNGKVTAMAKGTATITATAKTDTTQTATCAVTVEGANIVQPSGIKVSPLSLSLKVGGTGQVTATIDNENELDADHKKITWTSSKESVATVNANGLVTALSVGEATITATTTNNKSATCIVTVTEPVTITLAPSVLTLEVNKTETLVPTITGTDSKAVTWKSSDASIATVANGTVTAKKKGEATITVTLAADMEKTATCKVTVVDQTEVLPSGVTLNKNILNLTEGGKETLTATITNADEVKDEHKKITWTSSNKDVATVNNGLVTAVSAGTATITVATTNGKKAECTVTVTAQTSTTVAASDDAWNFVGKAGLADGDITKDTNFLGDKGNLTLNVLVETGTGKGTKGTRACQYSSKMGLGFKKDILKIDNIKGSVKVTIQWYLNGTKTEPRYLEVAVGNDELKRISSGLDNGDKDPYTVSFDAGDGKTLYIAASDWLYIKSITIEPQSGGTVTPPPTTTDPDPTDKTISLTDSPLGYASLGNSYATTSSTTVTTRSQLVNAIKNGGVIIIDGMIDMSEGKLPTAGSKSTDSTTALDTLVHNTYSKYANYAAWVKAYSEACALTTEDDTEYGKKDPFYKKDTNGQYTIESGVKNSTLRAEVVALNKAYGDLIKLTLKSGTTLIGKGPGCGIRGGSIQISNVSNIQIRNLTIQDAFDPFPHHEVKNSDGATDGYNAQWDGINIQNTCKNIWIDHVTFEDTITLDYVYTSGTSKEKWQTYDGLCDMKNDSTNITISNCIFRNHDKTMLIGSSDTDGDNSKRFVTLQGNYFFNCGQRLPMVRNTTIHILNNYYDASNPTYSQQYAVGCRKDSIIYAEANYFGSGIYYSFKDNDGELHSSGNTDNCQQKSKITSATDSKLFKDVVNAYTYTPVTAEQAKASAVASAGAGYTLK